MASKGISASELLSGSKQLSSAPESKASKSYAGAFDEASLKSLEEIYDKYNGNLDEIFAELKANPAKAKKPKYTPKNSQEFALKYLQGYYSLVDDEAEAKPNHK